MPDERGAARAQRAPATTWGAATRWIQLVAESGAARFAPVRLRPGYAVSDAEPLLARFSRRPGWVRSPWG